MTTNVYAIEIIGYGKHRKYVLRQIVSETIAATVDGRAYRTEQAARDAAERLGLTISAVGDMWQVMHELGAKR